MLATVNLRPQTLKSSPETKAISRLHPSKAPLPARAPLAQKLLQRYGLVQMPEDRPIISPLKQTLVQNSFRTIEVPSRRSHQVPFFLKRNPQADSTRTSQAGSIKMDNSLVEQNQQPQQQQPRGPDSSSSETITDKDFDNLFKSPRTARQAKRTPMNIKELDFYGVNQSRDWSKLRQLMV